MNATQYSKPPEETLRGALTPLQYDVTQRAATEPPFRNPYFDHFEPGIYVDVTTGEPLFASADKYQSGCGWPSFAKPISPERLEARCDTSHGFVRTEIRSKAGGAHLGHVFPDGPREVGGLRYCVNSAALRFVPLADMVAEGYGEWMPLVRG